MLVIHYIHQPIKEQTPVMATTVVTVPAKYNTIVKNAMGIITSNTDSLGGDDLFFDKRPDRVRMRKPTGWLYPKAYDMSTRTLRTVSGTIASVRLSDGTTWKFEGYLGSFVDGGLTVVEWSSNENERRASIIKALTKLKDQRINLGVALAEAQQTADFVGTTARKLARAALHAYDGNFKRAVRTLGGNNYRNYPKGWLGYQYAAMPLLSDVFGACQALEKRTNLFDWVVTVKGASRVQKREETVFQSQPNHMPGATFTDVHRRGYFTRLDYIPGNTFLSTLSSAGVTNPLEVLWEKIPFSFVVDWMLPVGEWLSTMDAALGFTFLSGSVSERIEAQRLTSVANLAITPGYRNVLAKYGGTQRFLSVKREVLSSSPIVAMPRIKNPLSLVHMANGLSLLAAVFGGRR